MLPKIQKVIIENYKCFEEKFTLELNEGMNIIVGDNEAGKSTILEAIHLALSGILHGRYLKNELTQYLFNYSILSNYIKSINEGKPSPHPHILIEIYFRKGDYPLFEGDGNSEKSKASGVVFKIEFDDQYEAIYNELLQSGELNTIPIEYYKVTWRSFARDSIVARSIPLKSVMIDSAANRHQNGSDIYLSRLINTNLDDSEKISIAQEYRKIQNTFKESSSITTINSKISEQAKISDKELKICVDLTGRNSWENTLLTHLDDVPFQYIGKGEQCIVKTNLALGHKKAKEANLILLEEPENHLSHSKLNSFVDSLNQRCDGKQIIISTHSSFVANKIGLKDLILINNLKETRFKDLEGKGTQDFFKKLPGYKTLRLLLCKKAVLVEGDSDELIVQRAYKDKYGVLPIQDDIEVISVGTSFLRFLELAEKIDIHVAVVTDNDGNYDTKISNKYKDYINEETPNIKICADDNNKIYSLEPQLVEANKSKSTVFYKALNIEKKSYPKEADVIAYMESKKTDCALAIFDSEECIEYPKYIKDAIEWCHE